MNVIQC